MGLELGILFAFAALLFWGFGDFMIQRSTRRFGDWETLFVITAFGAVALTPFIYQDLGPLFSLEDNTFLVLVTVSVVLLFASLLDFEALKKGKIAIVEPVLALEVPVTAILAFSIISEGLQLEQAVLITVLVAGLFLVSMKSHYLRRRAWLERGVFLAIAGSIFMGLSNFMVGFASRATNPLLTNWFINLFLTLISLFYIVSNRRIGKLVADFRGNTKAMLTVSTLDNLAWISFAFAASLIPIAVAVAISESYIALTALLGLLINRELLLKHQKIGLVIALGSAIILSAAV